MEKRRLIGQLPVVQQTETLKKFFGSTVDQAFQPGKAESLTGYIGQKTAYYNPETDFYVQEPTAARRAHQLAPAMVSRDAEGAIQQLQFYDDLVNYLAVNGGATSDPDRLFAGEYYAWAPPIDIDKILNPQHYYWFGDNPRLIPALTLTPPSTVRTADGARDAFPAPARMAGVDPSRETIVAFVDGYPGEGQPSDPDENGDCAFVFVKRPPPGATVRVYRYGDMRKVINGLQNFDPRPWTTETRVATLTSNMRLIFDDALAVRGYDNLPFEKSFVHGYDATPAAKDNPWDGDKMENESYWVEGVGAQIELIFVNEDVAQRRQPIHVVCDRRSDDWNPWARANYWVHRDAFAWSGKTFAARAARRPILEFVRNLKLWKYGTTRKPDIQATLTGDAMFSPLGTDPAQPLRRHVDRDVSNLDVLTWDETGYDGSALKPVKIVDVNGKPLGSVWVDQQRAMLFGDRILVLDNSDAQFNGRILTVRHAVVDGAEVLALQVSPAAKTGDIVRLRPRGWIPFDLIEEGYDNAAWEYTDVEIEYYYDGAAWRIAQRRDPVNPDPLFDLATYAHDAHADLAGAAFAGNRIFGFAQGDGGVADAVLNRVLKYDAFGQIVFEFDAATRKTVVSGAEVTGTQYYWTFGAEEADSVYCDGWHVADDVTRQTLDDDGVASIPLNLRANPNNLQPGFLSRNQWFEQFNACLKGQAGLVGSPTAINNWRDTARDLSKGRAILQHRAPLLKAMLLASDERFDYFDAVRYAEREYIRFRAKFIARAVDLTNSGALDASATVDAWVDAILANLRLEKSPEFPFALSGMAGVGNYIPPTPAFLGVAANVIPGVEVDTSYSQPVTFLRGHDGSRAPAFGDYRDIILLALEQRIYASIKDSFKDDRFEWLDLNAYIEGHSRRAAPGAILYGRDELTAIMTPIFLRWAQANGLDYTSNASFEPGDPWTWNYRGVLDAFGDPMPGHWRGVYRWHFDTDRPHLAPWEMLGFAAKPSWFDAEYGPAPYTSNNLPLWRDLRDGRIARGARAGVDARYARPDLLAILPVDDDGALRDPVQAGIIGAPVGPTLGLRPWVFGDHAPVENLWRMSPAFSFNMAEVGALLRPALWIEHNWDTGNLARRNGQWINTLTQNRAANAQLYVHGEQVTSDARAVRLGVQQWVSDLMVSRNQDPALLGAALRGCDARLAHKMAGFTQKSNLRVFTDNFGLIPSENVEVHLYEAPPYKQTFYSGVIIEWNGAGWRVVGYDNASEAFSTLPGDPNRSQTTIALGDDPAVYEWRAHVFYPLNRMVDHQGAVYTAVAAHTSTNAFEPTFWRLETGVVRSPKVAVCDFGVGEVAKVPYNTVFATYQEVASFLRDYFRWLEAEGFVFDALDGRTKETLNWHFVIREYLGWAQMKWTPGNFIALSPAAEQLKFVSEHGTVYNVETTVNGRAGLLDRTGRPIERRTTFVSRLDEETKIIATKMDLFGARLRLGEVEHVLVFDSTTVFNDLVYDPLLNLYQPRLRLIGVRATDWHGRRDAPGYLINGDNLLPSFERAAENLRDMYEVEGSPDAVLRDHARHLIGYQNRPYLDNLLVSETQQFEFYQGMIQQKGAPGVFDKLMRSHLIDRDRALSFLEEWAFKTAAYGALTNIIPVAFTLTSTDVRCARQLIVFDENHDGEAVLGLPADDPRWIEQPASLNVFPTVRGRPEFPHFDDALDQRPWAARGFDLIPPPGGPQVQRTAKWLPTAGYVRRSEVNLACFDRSYLDALYKQAKSEGKRVGVATRIWMYDRGDGGFTVLTGFPIGTSANGLDQIIGQSTEPALPANRMRLVFSSPHGFMDYDVGCQLLIAGPVVFATSQNSGTVEGFHTVYQIVDRHTLLIDSGMQLDSVDFTADDTLVAPKVYAFRETRFRTRAQAHDFWLRFLPPVGQYTYVDVANATGDWAVYKWDGTAWNLARQQPPKIDSEQLASAAIYDNRTVLNPETLTVNPPLLEGIPIIDLVMGLLPGEAETALTYKTPQDPAEYFATSSNSWGAAQVGELWWDTSAMRVLEAETDILPGGERSATEIQYRLANWGKFAPGSAINVYEWTRSYTHPYDFKGTLLNPENPNFVAAIELDPPTAQRVSVYYFWVRNPRAIPSKTAREFSAQQIADMLANAAGSNTPWVAPIAPNAMIAGGLESYLNSLSSVLQLGVARTATENNVHTEWELLRPQDSRAAPPDHLWTALRDSLVGFDDLGAPTPDPSLAPAKAVGLGLRPKQTLFADGRLGQLRARRSFIAMLNAILGRAPVLRDNTALTPYLSAETPTFEKLIWTQKPDAPDVVAPPVGAFDYSVNSLVERDALLLMPEFQATKVRAHKHRDPRILVTNLEAANPSWSVWSVDLAKLSAGDVGAALTLAANYDLTVATEADAVDLVAQNGVAAGQRVLIESDSRAAGFWTVYAYLPDHALADANGYVFENAQLYRVGDFWTALDWYADGYTPLNPPLVAYATLQARDLAEFPEVRNAFVKVNDDGRGQWCWSLYSNGGWIIVARQAGTLALSSSFYDPTRPVYGLADRRTSLVASRDGSWELRMLVTAMRLCGLANRDQNEVFFSMLHFMHVQQDHVDWAFKTSYMSVVGFNEALTQSAIQTLDTTDNLVSYLEEVKPYRVRLRDVSRVLTPDIDVANVQVFDFDKPLYYDAAQKGFRRLDPQLPDDALIIQTDPLYKRWYDNYAKPSYDLASDDYNPVRRLNVKLRFDRTDPQPSQPLNMGYGWDIYAFDFYRFDEIRDQLAAGGSAFARLLAFYNPVPGMRTDVADLLGLAFKGIQVDGGDLFVPQSAGDVTVWGLTPFDVDPYEALLPQGRDTDMDGDALAGPEIEIAANPSGADSYRLIDPTHNRWHPQELITTGSTTAIAVHVHTEPTAGAPTHTENYVIPSRRAGPTIPVRIDVLPATAQSVLVFRDGLRLPLSEYAVDYAALVVHVQKGAAAPQTISVHVFGAAGLTPILEQRVLPGDGGTDYALLAAPQGSVEALVDGVRQPTAQLVVVGAVVSLPNPAPLGAEVVLNVRASLPQNDDSATRARITGYTWNAPQIWTMPFPPQGMATGHLGAIADVDGLRLLPPFTRYGRFNDVNRAFGFKNVALDQMKVWLDGTRYAGLIPVVSNGVVHQDVPQDYVGAFGFEGFDDQDLFDVEGHLALIDGSLCATSRRIQAEEVIAVAYDDPYDYLVEDDQLTVLKPLDSSQSLNTITWSNQDLMGLQTHVFHGRTDGVYVLNANVRDAYLVARNGQTLVKHVDYETIYVTVDNLDWSGQPTGSFRQQIAVKLTGAQDDFERIVVFAVNGRPASTASDWALLSTKPNLAMVGDPVYGRTNGVQLVENSAQGPRNIYRMNGSWDVCHWRAAATAILDADVARSDATIVLRLSGAFQLPVPNADMNQPGAVYIAGERVEYFGLDIVGQIATLSRLRRGTRGTGIGVETRRLASYPGDGATTGFRLASSDAAAQVEVSTVDADGVRTYYSRQRDYAVAQIGDDVQVSFVTAPASGLTVYVAQSGNVGHRAGARVHTAAPTQAQGGAPFAIKDPGPVL